MCANNTKEYNKKNYKKYWGNKKAKDDRASRGRARYSLLKKKKNGEVGNVNVDHKDSNPQNNSKSNLRIISEKKNKKLGAEKANRNKKKKAIKKTNTTKTKKKKNSLFM